MVFTIMKRIKNITFICILAGMIAGCTGNFDSMNKNPLAATEVTPSLLLTKMEKYGFNYRPWKLTTQHPVRYKTHHSQAKEVARSVENASIIVARSVNQELLYRRSPHVHQEAF